MSRTAICRSLALVGLLLLATGVPAGAGAIDTDEMRGSPVLHRYVQGRLGDADFQIALPEAWNGKLMISTRGFSGDEFQNDSVYKQLTLLKGYAYAASDEGWNRFIIVDQPADKYYESRRPALYDAGLSMFGYNSGLEVFRAFPIFLRNYDVIADRIGDIIAARAADPGWDPATQPLTPPLAGAQIAALERIYDIPAHLANGFAYNVGRARGSEVQWPGAYVAILRYMQDSLAKFDRTYDPNGDGQVSGDEIKAWDAYASPIPVQHELRKHDLRGALQRPVLIGQGTIDPLVVPEENVAYKRLVESVLGVAGADAVLRVYLIPGMGHGGPQNYPFVDAALDALDAWVDFVESGAPAAPCPAS